MAGWRIPKGRLAGRLNAGGEALKGICSAVSPCCMIHAAMKIGREKLKISF